MNRIVITLMLMLLTAALLGCGGGGTGAPAPDDGNTAVDENPVWMPVGPSEVVGGHSTSVLPDQLNVLTGASAEALGAQLGKFGITVLSKSGGWATVELPAGMDLDWAAAELQKEYNIASAEKVNVLHTPYVRYDDPVVDRSASYIPFDPGYADAFIHLGWEDTDESGTIDADEYFYSEYIGQGPAMNTMNFPTAWEYQRSPGPAGREVRVAIIDAGFFDYSVWNRASFNETLLDADVSGAVAADGTVTTGLDAAAWDVPDDADPTTVELPYRTTGELMLGMLADTIGDPSVPDGYTLRAYDFDQSTDLQSNEIWNEGIAGMNDSATYVLIKTGQLGGGDTWEFTDNHIAEAIKYAAGASADDNGGLWPNGGCEADIILLGMFAEGAVAGVISTEIQTARDNNALVIAPAGDIVAAGYDSGTGTWNDVPVDINVTPVTPASDTNCIAVCATGISVPGGLGDVDIGGGDTVPNDMIGWVPQMSDATGLAYNWREIPAYANYGGDIAAVGYGIGWSFYWFVTGDGTAGDPLRIQPGLTWRLTYDSFGSVFSAAYVAGAASIVHQALHEANNAEPSDDDVWLILTDTMQYAPVTGIGTTGGLLDAGRATMSAFGGGALFQPSMYLDGVVVSQLPNYVEIETDFEMTPTVQLGTAPFTIRVNWDNGEDEVEQPWDNGTPVTLTGGWDTLGLKGINLEIEDADGQLVIFDLQIHVVGRLGAGITINDVNGSLVLPSTLAAGLNYRFNANPTNLYTGEIDGEPNVTTFSWDFDGDGTEDATGTSPAYGYPAAGDYTLELLVTETIRPSILFTMDVNVS